jgi:ribosomal protein S18 acetylase RimI-like enzyme
MPQAEVEGGCVIRRAGAGDFALIRGHYAITWNAHAASMPERFLPMEEKDFPPAHFRSYLNDENVLMLVAELEGAVAGSFCASIRQSDGHYGFRACRTMFVYNVMTEPAMRRRGVARALVGAAAEWAADKEVARVDLTVWSFNETAIALYRNLGFAAAYSGLTIPASELVARLGTGRLPQVPRRSWLSRLLWRR